MARLRIILQCRATQIREAAISSSRGISGSAWIDLAALSLIWGGSFFGIALALREMGPLTAVLHRVGWAAILLWIVVAMRGCALPRSPAVWGAFLIMGILNNVIPFSLMSWGQTAIESGLVAIFNATTALFGVVVAAMILSDETLTRRKLAGVLLGLAGVITLVGWRSLAEFDLRSLAQIAVVGGALSYAFAGVWARLTLGGLAPEVSAAGMLTGSTLVMAPLAVMVEGTPRLNLSLTTWAAIAGYAILCTAVAYLLYYRILRAAGAANLLLCTLMIPPVAIFLGWAFLEERLGPAAFAGFALIALGLLVIDGRILHRFTRGQPQVAKD